MKIVDRTFTCRFEWSLILMVQVQNGYSIVHIQTNQGTAGGYMSVGSAAGKAQKHSKRVCILNVHMNASPLKQVPSVHTLLLFITVPAYLKAQQQGQPVLCGNASCRCPLFMLWAKWPTWTEGQERVRVPTFQLEKTTCLKKHTSVRWSESLEALQAVYTI